MRVYEYAKQQGISHKDVIAFLRTRDIEVTSHMSVLNSQALVELDKHFKQSKPQEKSASEGKTDTDITLATATTASAVAGDAQSSQQTAPVQKQEKQKLVQEQFSAPVKPDHNQVAKDKDIIRKEREEKGAASLFKQPSNKQAAQPTSQSVNQVTQRDKDLRKPGASEKQELQQVSHALILEPMTVSELANRVQRPVNDIILALLRQGTVAAKNKVLPERVIEQIAKLYGFEIKKARKEEISSSLSPSSLPSDAILTGSVVEERLPIVVVMGHVDHGKTTLLDFIRKTKVAAKEKGGITQHLGAYEAHTPHGNLVFIDTPGHEAFTAMRERGTRIADIAILVVAADDGVMPQTVEAIKQAQNAKIPLVIALNKMDKVPESRLEKVYQELAQYGLIPEAWGGQTVCIPISAKYGTGVDDLLDVVVLQAKLMELTTVRDVPARGYILEAKKEKGRGAVATVLVQHGIARVGDYFKSGDTRGRVTSMVDSWGQRVTQILPSHPVQVAGFEDLPRAGELFQVISAEQAKKLKAVTYQEHERTSVVKSSGGSADKVLLLLLKVDNASTQEAVLSTIPKINTNAYKQIYVTYSGIGDVTESDVQLAYDTQATIYTLHAKVQANAAALALKLGVLLKQFDIIYKLFEDFERAAQEGKPVKKVLKKIGEAVVLKVFAIKNVGTVAGAQVTTGKITRDARAVVWRGKYKVGEGALVSLQRDKKTVKEVNTGYECAFTIQSFDNWLVDDRVEFYLEVPAE